MGNEIDARFSVNLKTHEVTGIDIMANSKQSRSVMKRLSDENPNMIQCTDKGEYRHVTIRFDGKEYKTNVQDYDNE